MECGGDEEPRRKMRKIFREGRSDDRETDTQTDVPLVDSAPLCGRGRG